MREAVQVRHFALTVPSFIWRDVNSAAINADLFLMLVQILGLLNVEGISTFIQNQRDMNH